MRRQLFILVLTIIMGISSAISVFAEPLVMTDGTIFDAEFYAEQNPDVVEAVGTDEYALYQHYNDVGEDEGRLAVALQGSAVVSKVQFFEGNSMQGYIYTLEEGTLVRVTNRKSCNLQGGFDNKYIIPRTDYSTGLLDKDGNGIDDRDPYNDMGYSDTNYNCIADGAPVREIEYERNIAMEEYLASKGMESVHWTYTSEEKKSIYVRLCDHNIVGGDLHRTFEDSEMLCFCSICEEDWKTFMEDLGKRITMY